MVPEFTKSLLNYAKLHPDDPTSVYILENYKESIEAKRKESRKWRLIATALEHLEERSSGQGQDG
jgi:hypothetical protein